MDRKGAVIYDDPADIAAMERIKGLWDKAAPNNRSTSVAEELGAAGFLPIARYKYDDTGDNAGVGPAWPRMLRDTFFPEGSIENNPIGHALSIAAGGIGLGTTFGSVPRGAFAANTLRRAAGDLGDGIVSAAKASDHRPFYGADVGPKGRIASPSAEVDRLDLIGGLPEDAQGGFFNPGSAALLQGGVQPRQTVAYYRKQMGSRGGKLPPGQWDDIVSGKRPDEVIDRDWLVKQIDERTPGVQKKRYFDDRDLERAPDEDPNIYAGPTRYQSWATPTKGAGDYEEVAVGYSSVPRAYADNFRDGHFSDVGDIEGWYRQQMLKDEWPMSPGRTKALEDYLDSRNAYDAVKSQRDELNKTYRAAENRNSEWYKQREEEIHRQVASGEMSFGDARRAREALLIPMEKRKELESIIDKMSALPKLPTKPDFSRKTLLVDEVQPQRYQRMREVGPHAPDEEVARLEDIARSAASNMDQTEQAVRSWLVSQGYENAGTTPITGVRQMLNDLATGTLERAGDPKAFELRENLKRASDRAMDTYSKLESAKEGVAKSPFTHDVNAATQFLEKSILHDAASKNVDQISWAPGPVQADRYNQSLKDVKALSYDPESGNLYMRRASDGDGGVWYSVASGVTDEKLADYVGKDAAQKLLRNKPPDPAAEFSLQIAKERVLPSANLLEFPEGMTLGGDGMIGFYGDGRTPGIMGSNLQSLLGRLGQKDTMIRPGGFEPLPPGYSLDNIAYPAVPLDKATREAIKRVGLPIYSTGGPPLPIGAFGLQPQTDEELY